VTAPIAKRRVEHQVAPPDAFAPSAEECSVLDTALAVDAPSPRTATTPASSASPSDGAQASPSDGSQASAGVAVTTTATETAPETAPGTASELSAELSATRAQLLELQATRRAEQVRLIDG